MQSFPCKYKHRIPHIHKVNIERYILRSARSSPSQMNFCFGKKTECKKAEVFFPLLLPLVCTLYSGRNQPQIQANALFTYGAELPISMSTQMSTTFSEYSLKSERYFGFIQNRSSNGRLGTVSLPQLFL